MFKKLNLKKKELMIYSLLILFLFLIILASYLSFENQNHSYISIEDYYSPNKFLFFFSFALFFYSLEFIYKKVMQKKINSKILHSIMSNKMFSFLMVALDFMFLFSIMNLLMMFFAEAFIYLKSFF